MIRRHMTHPDRRVPNRTIRKAMRNTETLADMRTSRPDLTDQQILQRVYRRSRG